VQWQALALWADVLADAGKLQQAIFVGKLALTQLQQQRQRLLPLGNVADTRYLADKAPVYRRVADWLLQVQRIPEALEVMRLLKAQEQADFNERGHTEDTPVAGVGFTPVERSALRQFEAAVHAGDSQAEELRHLSERATAQRITPEEAQRLAQLRLDAAARLDTRFTWLGELPSGSDAKATATNGKLMARVRRPPARQLHVYTLAGERRLSVLLVRSDGTELHQINLSSAELAQQVGSLRDALSSKAANVQPQAQALYRQVGRLIDTAARRQGAKQIVVWLDGPLRYLPPGLMHDGTQPMATRYSWIVDAGPASGKFPHGASSPAWAQPRIAAFGVTRAFQGLPALAAVGDELCDIVNGPVLGLDTGAGANRCIDGTRGRGPMPGQARLNALFTEENLLQTSRLREDKLLHISTHFVLRPGSIAKSWLLLGDGKRLPLERLRELDLGAPTLVTLSACETAVVDAAGGSGREVDGLATTLLDRGARQVLASLWRVDDRATARFMQRFYAAYAKLRGQASTALKEAQRQAIDEGAPEREWAAFVLLGASAMQP
jgi:CHAT domain-containing protein